MGQTRTPTPKRADKPSLSDTFIYKTLMLNEIKEKVPGADTIPSKNKVLKRMVSLYVQRTLVGNNIASPLSTEKLLEFIEAGVGKLPKSDTSKELTRNIDDLRKLLSERKDLRDLLTKEFDQLVADTNKSMQDICGLVVPQPDAQEGNVAIKNTLETKIKLLTNFSNKVLRAADQVMALADAAQDLAGTYSKVSGVVIKPTSITADQAPQISSTNP